MFRRVTFAFFYAGKLFTYRWFACFIVFNAQIANFSDITKVTVYARDAINSTVNGCADNGEVAWTTVVGAVTARTPQFAVLTRQSEVALYDSVAVFGILLQYFVWLAAGAIGGVMCYTADNGQGFAVVGRRIFTNIFPDYVFDTAVA